MNKESKEKKVEVVDKRVTNKQFIDDDYFKVCCVRANIEPTARQASKFRRKIGIAYKFRKSIDRDEADSNNKKYRKGSLR